MTWRCPNSDNAIPEVLPSVCRKIHTSQKLDEEKVSLTLAGWHCIQLTTLTFADTQLVVFPIRCSAFPMEGLWPQTGCSYSEQSRWSMGCVCTQVPSHCSIMAVFIQRNRVAAKPGNAAAREHAEEHTAGRTNDAVGGFCQDQ